MIKISVIIPVYNSQDYLKRCMSGILNQTLADIEIICVNDGSTDNSLKILNDYSQSDKRIKIINLEKNFGAGEAKNAGLKVATGCYLAFLDPDDTIDLNYYEELYKKANQTQADIVKAHLITIETDGSRKVSNINNLIKTRSKFYFSYEYTSAIYKKSLVFDNNIKFPTDLIIGEDVVFLHRLIIKAKTISLINNTNYYYIKRENSLNTKIYDEKRIDSSFKTLEYMLKNYDASIDIDLSQKTYLEQYYANICSLLEITMEKTNEIELKKRCVKKFIEFYNNCKLQSEFNNFFLKNYPEMFDFIKNNDEEKILEICLKYKRFQNYCMLKQLRNSVNKDLKYGKRVGNNSCI